MPFLQIALALVIVAVFAAIVNTSVRIPQNARPIINLVLVLMVVGMVLWMINTYVPMADSIKAILNIVVVVATCVWVLQAFGLWDGVVKLWNKVTKRVSTPSDQAHVER